MIIISVLSILNTDNNKTRHSGFERKKGKFLCDLFARITHLYTVHTKTYMYTHKSTKASVNLKRHSVNNCSDIRANNNVHIEYGLMSISSIWYRHFNVGCQRCCSSVVYLLLFSVHSIGFSIFEIVAFTA